MITNPKLHSSLLIIWTFYTGLQQYVCFFSSFSHSDLCEPAASGPAGAAPRGPTEATGNATEAAGRTGGAGAEDEGAAGRQRG